MQIYIKMSEPTEEWCPIFYFVNGGEFNDKGHPTQISTTLGNCPVPWDCLKCEFLQQWLQNMRSYHWAIRWECVDCISESAKKDKESGIVRILPGFYQSGRSAETPGYLLEQFPNFDNSDPDSGVTTLLEGCTSCHRQSSLLQVILRRKNAE